MNEHHFNASYSPYPTPETKKPTLGDVIGDFARDWSPGSIGLLALSRPRWEPELSAAENIEENFMRLCLGLATVAPLVGLGYFAISIPLRLGARLLG